jgi:putative ABC transport system permease protein
MMLPENIKMGVHSIRKARLRSFFTMLGIIIGVVSAVTIVSLGEGVKRQVASQMSELGTNLITVRSGKLVNRDATGAIESVNLFGGLGTATLTEQDATAVKKLSDIEAATSFSSVSAVASNNGTKFTEGSIIATTEDLRKVMNHKVEFGTFFDSEEANKKVAVIGSGVAEKLFHEAVPLGKTITIRDQQFIVEGVFERFNGDPLANATDFNNTIFIPYSVAKTISGGNIPIYEILVKAKDTDSLNAAASQVNDAIQKNHGGQQDFTVLKGDEAAEASGNVLKLLTKMVIGMAAITLFVGGIGIMNVMLVSVSERTREIGIRKAIGATNSQIRSQFMMEATILSVWGVLIGICVAVLLNIILRIFTDLQPVITLEPVILASIISIAVGIIFGVIPAVKAARKDPIDSLRANE